LKRKGKSSIKKSTFSGCEKRLLKGKEKVRRGVLVNPCKKGWLVGGKRKKAWLGTCRLNRGKKLLSCSQKKAGATVRLLSLFSSHGKGKALERRKRGPDGGGSYNPRGEDLLGGGWGWFWGEGKEPPPEEEGGPIN